jgi:PAS domain S-box-containing protein
MNLPSNSEPYQLLSQALEGGCVGTWYWDIGKDRYEWSALCRKYLALPKGQEPSIEHLYAVLHPEDRPRIEQLVNGSFASATSSYQDDFRVIDRDGKARWISSSWSVHRDAQGQPYAMAGTVIDITERMTTSLLLKETLAALEMSEQRFRLAMEAAQEGIWDWRLDSGEVYFSPGYAAMLGHSFHRIKPHVSTWIGLMHPDDAESVINEATQRLRHPGHYSLEFRMRHADGSYRWIQSKGKVIERDDMGEPLRAIGTHIDITKHKAAEDRLEESRHLLELALAGAELGTWDVDILSGYSAYDARYSTMLGYEADGIDPTMDGWLNLIHPDDRPAVQEAMRAHLAGETRIYEVEHRLRHKAGHWIWVLARGKVSHDSTGQPVRATGTIIDITDRKRVSTEGAELLHKIEALIGGLDRRAGLQTTSNEDESSAKLSPRNRQVLGLIAGGLTSAEIAKRLGISNQTAMTHRRNLMRKLGLRNKAELIRYAIKHKISAA